VWSNARHLSNLIIMSTRPNNEKMRILERGFNATPSLDRLYKKLVLFHNRNMVNIEDIL